MLSVIAETALLVNVNVVTELLNLVSNVILVDGSLTHAVSIASSLSIHVMITMLALLQTDVMEMVAVLDLTNALETPPVPLIPAKPLSVTVFKTN